MTTELNTLLTALCVKIDDEIGGIRGRPPLLSDSELVCLAVAQALLGYHSESRWLRYANKHLTGMFPYLPQRAGYYKRLRSTLGLVKRMIRELAMDSDFWFDNLWITDSTPVPCGMSRPTVQRSNLAGWAGYGYCASHSRFFWGLGLYLVCTPTGMPIMWSLANPKIGEREVLATMVEVDADLVADREGIVLISAPHPSFTPESKAEIVEQCWQGDRSVGEVDEDFDLTETAVRLWVSQRSSRLRNWPRSSVRGCGRSRSGGPGESY
ncbi:hypothetical protein [Streptomyces sp. NBC_00988]|uniref:hypothetical protein n=1 Tax=Streptomyces sp. NBC_00988 TaxID=2903704 RepID=UPI003867ED9F